MKMETIEELKQRGDAKREQTERKEMDLHLAHHRAALAANAEQEQPTHGPAQTETRKLDAAETKAERIKARAESFKTKMRSDRENDRGRDR
jgi:hypothetical protein